MSLDPPLEWPLRAAFAVILSLEVFVFTLGAVRLLIAAAALRPRLHFAAASVYRPESGKANFAVALVALVSFYGITAHYEVLDYVRDGLDLALIRKLAGGVMPALKYAREELLSVVPTALLLLAAVMLARLGLRRGLAGTSLPRPLGRILHGGASIRLAVLGNVLALALPVVLAQVSPALERALARSLPHRLYSGAAGFLTDFDRDGYGLTPPVDFASFDRTRHPYAVEAPGNGIDENGIGGDLPAVAGAPLRMGWDRASLKKKNVLIVVLDSARSDLAESRLDGQDVMPNLRRLEGRKVLLVSHCGFSGCSIESLLTGRISPGLPSTPLIEIFRGLDYATGVFSGQDERSGGIPERTGMRDADLFVDASQFPGHTRMHATTSPASIATPAPLVAARFTAWLNGLAPDRPFFAYLNWQETHFPYDYLGAPRLLTPEPIPRRLISPANRAWTRRTYLNAAHNLDRYLGGILELLERRGCLRETLVAVLGDHGEEFFEHGCLGHGVNLSLEQNTMLCRLINADWAPAADAPVGLADLAAVFYNSLVLREDARIRLRHEVLCHVGGLDAPREIGLIDSRGLVKYDFLNDAWRRQASFGERMFDSPPAPAVVHAWESLVIRASRPDAQGRRGPG